MRVLKKRLYYHNARGLNRFYHYTIVVNPQLTLMNPDLYLIQVMLSQYTTSTVSNRHGTAAAVPLH
ncbi:MAG TPA: hypothetical protein VLA24_17970 [Pseudomonadales bacterium]|nr:hypothetical protein [Pseudomonadales bacterium]